MYTYTCVNTYIPCLYMHCQYVGVYIHIFKHTLIHTKTHKHMDIKAIWTDNVRNLLKRTIVE